MIWSRTTRFSLLALIGALALGVGGCSYLLPVRAGVATSYEIVIDTRRVPAPALTGCTIPETFPAVSKVPVVFVQPIPYGAVFTSVKADVVLKNETGDPLSLLETSIENNQVYLKCAANKPDAFTQVHVVVTGHYEYR
jgi:hypothetical protein